MLLFLVTFKTRHAIYNIISQWNISWINIPHIHDETQYYVMTYMPSLFKRNITYWRYKCQSRGITKKKNALLFQLDKTIYMFMSDTTSDPTVSRVQSTKKQLYQYFARQVRAEYVQNGNCVFDVQRNTLADNIWNT